MIEHLTQNQVEDYCRQQLRTAELLSVSDHLGECEPCRRRIEFALNGDAAFFALRSQIFSEAAEVSSPVFAQPHPTLDQTAGYVDGILAAEERQMVADHLTRCVQCALAVDDLRAFKSQIAPSLDREYQPAQPRSSTEGWWQRVVAALPPLFGQSPGLAFGAGIAVLLLAVTGWLIWRTPGEREPKQELVVSPTPTPQPVPVPPAPQLVAQLTDGEGRLTLDQEGKLSGADDLPPVYQSMLKEALTNPRIQKSPMLTRLTQPPSSLMSTDNQRREFFVIEPVGEVLLTARPTLRWSAMEGATGYVVEIYDSKFNLVAASPQLTSRSWVAPALSRGNIYAWQVKALKDGQEITAPRPPAPQARFRILEGAKVNELVQARRAHPSSHLVLGLLYAEAGLLKEAEQELRLLQKANPDSEIARSLLNQVRARRR